MQKEFKDLLENAYYDVLTSRVSKIDEVLSIPYGAADFITKPCNLTILFLRIQNILKRVNQEKDKLKYLDLDVYQNRIVSQDELMNI